MSEQLKALTLRFVARCAADLELVRAALDNPTVAASANFAEIVHKLAGVSGIFGFPTLNDAACQVDDVLVAKQPLSATTLATLVDELRKVVESR